MKLCTWASLVWSAAGIVQASLQLFLTPTAARPRPRAAPGPAGSTCWRSFEGPVASALFLLPPALFQVSCFELLLPAGTSAPQEMEPQVSLRRLSAFSPELSGRDACSVWRWPWPCSVLASWAPVPFQGCGIKDFLLSVYVRLVTNSDEGRWLLKSGRKLALRAAVCWAESSVVRELPHRFSARITEPRWTVTSGRALQWVYVILIIHFLVVYDRKLWDWVHKIPTS